MRELQAAGGVVRAVSAHDALSARLVEQAGFPAIAIGGNALAASTLGVPFFRPFGCLASGFFS